MEQKTQQLPQGWGDFSHHLVAPYLFQGVGRGRGETRAGEARGRAGSPVRSLTLRTQARASGLHSEAPHLRSGRPLLPPGQPFLLTHCPVLGSLHFGH